MRLITLHFGYVDFARYVAHLRRDFTLIAPRLFVILILISVTLIVCYVVTLRCVVALRYPLRLFWDYFYGHCCSHPVVCLLVRLRTFGYAATRLRVYPRWITVGYVVTLPRYWLRTHVGLRARLRCYLVTHTRWLRWFAHFTFTHTD